MNALRVPLVRCAMFTALTNLMSIPVGTVTTEVDEDGYSDAAGSKRDKAFNKASMLREARKDNRARRDGGSSVGTSSTRGGGSTVTFVVGQNGSYEQK